MLFLRLTDAQSKTLIFIGLLFFLAPFSGLAYWAAPLVSFFIFAVVSGLNFRKFINPLSLILFLLSISFWVSALGFNSNSEFGIKRALRFSLLIINVPFFIYFLQINFRNFILITVSLMSIFILIALIALSPPELGSIRTHFRYSDHKNLYGIYLFLSSLCASIYFSCNKDSVLVFVYNLFILMAVPLFWSAKAALGVLLAWIGSLFFIHTKRVAWLAVFIVLGVGAVTLMAFAIAFDLFGSSEFFRSGVLGYVTKYTYPMISKVLAVFSDNFHVGQHGISNRIYYFNETIRLYFESNLLFGLGLEGEREFLGTYSHNSYSTVLLGSGIVGFSIFITLQVYALVKIFATRHVSKILLCFFSFLSMQVFFFGQKFYDYPSLILAIAVVWCLPEYFKDK